MDTQPKANWVHSFGPFGVSEKGFVRVTDETGKVLGMFPVDALKAIVNNPEQALETIACADGIRGERKQARELQKIEAQAQRAKARELQKVQASLESLQRAGINIEQLNAFIASQKVG